jgi:hypothetical protein
MSVGVDVDIPEAHPAETPSRLRWVVLALAIWNGLTTCLLLTVALLCGQPVMRAVFLMTTGVSLLWIYTGGLLMHAFRDPIRARIRTLRLDWRITFVLFCTLLALLEEVVTTAMTNCAPLFGVPMGRAYITASANYLDVVCLHSVVVFVPMFFAWAWMLSRWNFHPYAVLLLFGITGLMAEISFSGLQSLPMFGFWIFVYGLMVYLPACCVPEDRPVRRPGPVAILFAPILPILFAIPLALIVSRLHPIKIHFPPLTMDPPKTRQIKPHAEGTYPNG